MMYAGESRDVLRRNLTRLCQAQGLSMGSLTASDGLAFIQVEYLLRHESATIICLSVFSAFSRHRTSSAADAFDPYTGF